MGTPQVVTDENQQVVWQGDYSPFGESTETINSVTQNLRFPGQYFDVETGLHYNYFRDYSPATGRYVQSDPIGLAGGLNNYAYVDGNPLMYTDPTGEFAWGLAFAGADLAWQLYQNNGDLSCVNWTDVGLSLLGGGLLNGLTKGAFRFKTVGSNSWRATKHWMRKKNIHSLKPGQERHHWFFERNQGFGKKVPDSIKNQLWNLNPISVPFNNWLGRKPWRAPMAAPSWVSEIAGGAGLAAGSDCGCK